MIKAAPDEINPADEIVRIDSRVMGFNGDPVRILAVCFKDTGEMRIEKKEIYTNLPVPEKLKPNTIVVTDAIHQVQNWDLPFNAEKDLASVITVYQQRYRAGLIEIEKSLTRFNPKNVLQVRKVDEKGLKQEFDSSSLNNGHVAVLLCVWASQRVAISHSITHAQGIDSKAIDTSMLPFSI